MLCQRSWVPSCLPFSEASRCSGLGEGHAIVVLVVLVLVVVFLPLVFVGFPPLSPTIFASSQQPFRLRAGSA